jgi:hypothetical protein
MIIANFDTQVLDEVKTDPKLVNQIGDFREHNFSYIPLAGNADSVSFEIQIFGSEKDLVIEGYAVQKEGQWNVVKQKSTLFEKE